MHLSVTSPMRPWDSGTWCFSWMVRQHQIFLGLVFFFFWRFESPFFILPIVSWHTNAHLFFFFLFGLCSFANIKISCIKTFIKKIPHGWIKNKTRLRVSPVSVQSWANLSFFFSAGLAALALWWLPLLTNLLWAKYFVSIFYFSPYHKPTERLGDGYFHIMDENAEAYSCKSSFHLRTVLWSLKEMEEHISRQNAMFQQNTLQLNRSLWLTLHL